MTIYVHAQNKPDWQTCISLLLADLLGCSFVAARTLARLAPTTSALGSWAEGASSAMASNVVALSSVCPPGANAYSKSVFTSVQ